MQRIATIEATDISPDGAVIGSVEGESIHVFGMLPGEKGVISVRRHKKSFIGDLSELTQASSRRMSPGELHYLTCSPWQIMEYPLQLELKREILERCFSALSVKPEIFHPARVLAGYRTKVEFSFTDRTETGDAASLQLAFHKRTGGAVRVALPDGCLLLSPGMNKAALRVTEVLRAAAIPARALKSLIVRESKATGDLLILLYVKDEIAVPLRLADIPGAKGLQVHYSTPKSPASVSTRLIRAEGENFLVETVGGKEFRYGPDAFFQNNVPMFELAVERMRPHVPEGGRILELYAGVGTIGILLSDIAEETRGIESVGMAVENARTNAAINEIFNYRAEESPAEQMLSVSFSGMDAVIVDPPRTGLHPRLIATILENPPSILIYLSCNPVTAARDAALLSGTSTLSTLEGFDFYPQTPHMECLLVFRRIS